MSETTAETAASSSNKKRRILAIRHGQSIFNVLFEQFGKPEEDSPQRYRKELYVPDCDITEFGRQQSRQAGKALMTIHGLNDNINNIHFVVSPLRRTLQTTLGIFKGASEATANKPWQPTSMIVQPLAAEILLDACDIGTPISLLQQEFPTFDMTTLLQQHWWPFSHSPDEAWRRMSRRLPEGIESTEHAVARITQLKEFLRNDPTCQRADVVVVVCHSDTIWYLTSHVGKDGDRYGTRTQNGEILDITQHVLLSKEHDNPQGKA